MPTHDEIGRVMMIVMQLKTSLNQKVGGFFKQMCNKLKLFMVN